MTTAQVAPVEQAAQDDAAAKIAAAEAEVVRYRAEAEAVEVRTVEEAQAATTIVSKLAAETKRLEAERVELVKPLKDYTKGIDEKYKLAKAPLEAATKTLKERIISFNEEEEARRQEAQRKIDQEREERERQIAERRAAEEAEARQQQEKREADQREAEELAAEDPELAELVDETRDAVREAKTNADVVSSLPAPSIPKATVAPAPKLNGAGATKRWDFEVLDITSVPDFLPDGTPLKTVDTAALRRYMHEVLKQTDGTPPTLAGVKFEQVSGLAVRG